MKNSIIAAILSLITLFVISDLDLFETLFWFPNFLWILPLYLFFKISVYYFTTLFTGKGSVVLKISMLFLNLLLIVFLLKTGFGIWKVNNGNILLSDVKPFQITLKNIWFWVVFQSYLLLFFLSGFKLLVTIDQK